MGSLRNPVGPLPSSIYWRRRVVLLSVVALLALVIILIVTTGGGGGGKNTAGSDGKNPTHTITPGPSPSGSAISQHPGGREESGGGDTGGGADSGSSGDGGASGTAAGSGGSSGAGGSAGSAGSAGAGTGSGGAAVAAGDALPGSSALPDCTSGAVTLSLRSLRNSYSPDQTPTFELTAKNGSSADCKVDLGPKHAVLTITPADGDDAFWSSDDCPKGPGSLAFRVPAGQSITYTVKWDREPGAAHCGTPSGGSAKPGTYLLEAKAPGYGKLQASFVLSAD
ncbi:hypothetical protein [Streptomyces sp. NPDC002343]